MPDPLPALAPAPVLFDVTTLTDTGIDGTLARLPLEKLELAENPRKTISADGIERLAGMLMRLGQLSPASAGARRPGGPSASSTASAGCSPRRPASASPAAPASRASRRCAA